MSRNHETLLEVMGLSCPSCVAHIDEALRDIAGVSAVEVRMADGRVLVRHDPGVASLERLVEALRDAGYEATQSKAA